MTAPIKTTPFVSTIITHHTICRNGKGVISICYAKNPHEKSQAQYYTRDVKTMPVVVENNIDLKDVIGNAILTAVHNAKDGERR